jgi:hypothetical protein
MVVHDGVHDINLQGESLVIRGSATAKVRGSGRVLVCTSGCVDIEGSFVVTVIKGQGTFHGCSVFVYGDIHLQGDSIFVVIPKGRRPST